jgi:ferric-dicitrate binding protein FerR (iron transport regulator)
MNTEKKAFTGRDKMWYLAIIAEKDREIEDLKFEHKRELAEKDKVIEFYRKTAEKATDRKQRAIRNAERRAKLNLSYALLLIAGMAVIPWVLWLVDAAFKSFWLWAN